MHYEVYTMRLMLTIKTVRIVKRRYVGDLNGPL